MTFTERLNADLAAAMRAREPNRLVALRMLKTALTNKSVEKGRELDTAESLQVIATLIKQRRESIEQFEKGGRHDLAAREAAEIAVLEAYLPPPMSEVELGALVDEAIADSGATSARDMGKVMKLVMNRVAGRTVDGRVVSEMVRRKLG